MSTRRPPAAIQARDITLQRGQATVIDGFSFRMARGTLTALIGANGSGKSSLLQALLGLLPLRAGQVRILRQPPRQARRHVGYVPQAGQHLLDNTRLQGREFVAAAYRGQRWGINWHARTAARAVDWALRQTGSVELADHPLQQLSGGQCQRLLIAQALVNRPEVLLMDEPLAQLDPAAQTQIVDLVSDLCRRHGLTVLLSSHDLAPLLGHASDMLYLSGGRGRAGRMQDMLDDQVLAELYRVPVHLLRHHQASRSSAPPPQRDAQRKRNLA